MRGDCWGFFGEMCQRCVSRLHVFLHERVEHLDFWDGRAMGWWGGGWRGFCHEWGVDGAGCGKKKVGEVTVADRIQTLKVLVELLEFKTKGHLCMGSYCMPFDIYWLEREREKAKFPLWSATPRTLKEVSYIHTALKKFFLPHLPAGNGKTSAWNHWLHHGKKKIVWDLKQNPNILYSISWGHWLQDSAETVYKKFV